VFVTHYDDQEVVTFTPAVVDGFLRARERERTLKNNATDKRQQMTHSMAELAYKKSANSVYGYYGSLTSDIPCTPVAQWICAASQNMTLTVRREAILAGALPIGGDTDSIFSRWKVDPEYESAPASEQRKHIKEKAEKLAAKCSQLFAPCKIVVENLFPKYWLICKKTYAAQKEDGKIIIKGLTVIKRDKCEAAQQIGLEVCTKIIEEDEKISITEYESWLKTTVKRVIPFRKIKNGVEVAPFVLTTALGVEYANKDQSTAVKVAEQLLFKYGITVKPKDRVKYVVTHRPSVVKYKVDQVDAVEVFLETEQFLDVAYYLEKQVFSVLKQILQLPEHKILLSATRRTIDSLVFHWKTLLHRHSFQEE